jgi:hypothetical protein
VINARRLSLTYFSSGTISAQVPVFKTRSGIGIQQKVVSGSHRFLCEIDRLWMTILDQDRNNKSRESHGTHH